MRFVRKKGKRYAFVGLNQRRSFAMRPVYKICLVALAPVILLLVRNARRIVQMFHVTWVSRKNSGYINFVIALIQEPFVFVNLNLILMKHVGKHA